MAGCEEALNARLEQNGYTLAERAEVMRSIHVLDIVSVTAKNGPKNAPHFTTLHITGIEDVWNKKVIAWNENSIAATAENVRLSVLSYSDHTAEVFVSIPETKTIRNFNYGSSSKIQAESTLTITDEARHNPELYVSLDITATPETDPAPIIAATALRNMVTRQSPLNIEQLLQPAPPLTATPIQEFPVINNIQEYFSPITPKIILEKADSYACPYTIPTCTWRLNKQEQQQRLENENKQLEKQEMYRNIAASIITCMIFLGGISIARNIPAVDNFLHHLPNLFQKQQSHD